MEIAITFVAPIGSRTLLEELGLRLGTFIGGGTRRTWLADGQALDLLWQTDKSGEAEELARLRRIVSDVAANDPADWCVQPAKARRKRMLIADMDSTIIGQECIDEMADLKGIKPRIAAITERAMRGELDFEAGLRERMHLLAGLTEADLRQVLDQRVTLNPGARELVGTMNANGAYTVLVSGGFTFFTTAVARRAGFAGQRGNSLIWDGGRICGVAEPIQGREAKRIALEEECAAHGVHPAEVIAVGDGANDLAMLRTAGLGVAYYAKPAVAAEADARINHTDLTTLLYFQGYASSDVLRSAIAR